MSPKEKQATPKMAFVFLGPLTKVPPAKAGSGARQRGEREWTRAQGKTSVCVSRMKKILGDKNMRTIGLIGGMSWESTIPYYRIINEEVKEKMGGLHSAKIILYSVEFDEIEKCQSENRWEESGEILGKAAQALETAGADFILICTNTMHKVAPQIASMIKVPIIHIADATADELDKARIKRVGLLGTKYTMTQDFYKKRLVDRGIDVLIPEEREIETVNSIIFNELCVGTITEESRKKFQDIIEKLKEKGADGVILGCTEIGLLISQSDVSIPVFDTTVIHAKRAAKIAMED